MEGGPAGAIAGALEAFLHGGDGAVAEFAGEMAREASDPYYACAYGLVRARALLSMGRPDEARAAADEAMAGGGGNDGSWISMGNLLQSLGDHQAALDAFLRAGTLACVHTAPSAVRGIAYAERSMKRHEKCIAAAETALAMEPGDTAALELKADSLASLGRHAEALECAEAGLAAGHDYYLARAKAACLLELGRDSDALKVANALLKESRGDPLVWYAKARLLARRGKADAALDSLAAAVALDGGAAGRAAAEADFGQARGGERFARITGS